MEQEIKVLLLIVLIVQVIMGGMLAFIIYHMYMGKDIIIRMSHEEEDEYDDIQPFNVTAMVMTDRLPGTSSDYGKEYAGRRSDWCPHGMNWDNCPECCH